jgi:hypothetical protein
LQCRAEKISEKAPTPTMEAENETLKKHIAEAKTSTE